MARCSPADLENEQTLRTEHQNADHAEQDDNLRHRAAEEEFQGRAGLRDRECGRDSADETLRATEHDDKECVNDVQAGRRWAGRHRCSIISRCQPCPE